jgi:hypothetical protein
MSKAKWFALNAVVCVANKLGSAAERFEDGLGIAALAAVRLIDDPRGTVKAFLNI